MKPKLAFAWFLVSLALTSLLVVNWRGSRQREERLEALQVQFETLDKQDKAGRARVAELEKELQRARGELRAAEVEASNSRLAYEALSRMTNGPGAHAQRGSNDGASAGQQQGGGMGSFLANMMKDPEMRKAMEQQQRMGLDMIYGSLFKQLQLTPEKEKDFKDALLAMQMTNMVQAGAMFEAGSTNRAEAVQKLAEGHKQMEEQMKNILGEQKFGQFQDYSQTLGERMMIDQFSKQTTISPEQSEQLLAIMREEKKNMQVNMGGETFDPNKDWQKFMESGDAAEKVLTQQQSVNERVMERANEVLTPEQAEKFRPFITNQFAMQRAGLKMARQMFQSPAAPNPPPQQP